MLQASNLSKSYGDRLLFAGVSFVINSGDRIALIGPNGSGKTTLLRILAGQLASDTGSVASGRIGYLPQGADDNAEGTVEETLRRTRRRVPTADLEQQLESIAARMQSAGASALPALLADYQRALDELEGAGDNEFERALSESMTGLNLDPQSPVGTLSGGQKTRLRLASVLLSEPEVLLLDEPTNHLDVSALEWLETFLASFAGGALIVSHDRTLLNRVTNGILELNPAGSQIRSFAGNYDDYVAALETERRKQWAAYQDQQEFVGRLERSLTELSDYARSIEQGTINFAPRKIARGLARRAIVQRRRIERLLDSEERIDKPERSWEMKLEFGAAIESKDVVQLEDVDAGYDGVPVLSGLNLRIQGKERVALVGDNGSGKTTLARTVCGLLPPLAGRRVVGPSVEIGYYTQEQEQLDLEETPYELIRSAAAMDQTEARSFLHYFLFAGDDVFKRIDMLSFGERARLALAWMVARGCNFLVLDEPINHLDIPSRSRFETALARFTGPVLVVSHDRYFVSRFATVIWQVRDGGTSVQSIDVER